MAPLQLVIHRLQRTTTLCAGIAASSSTTWAAPIGTAPLAVESPLAWGGLLGIGAIAGALAATWFAHRRPAVSSPTAAPLSELEEIPAPVLVMDLTAVGQYLASLRASGVSDLRQHLREHPELSEHAFHLIRIADANRAAIGAADYGDIHELQANFALAPCPPYWDAFPLILDGIWERRWLIEGEYEYRDIHNKQRVCLIRGALQDLAKARLLIVDLTVTKTSIAAHLSDHEQLRDILVGANILLWWAKVYRENGRLRWKFDVPAQATKSEIYRLASAIDVGGLWDNARLPDAERILAEAEAAVLGGATHYEHEFRVLGPDRMHWIREETAIQKLSEGEWSLVGIATDVTKRHDAEDAKEHSALQLQQILTRQDCMVWQATVTDLGEKFDWFFDIPQSGLQKRIFGGDTAIKTKTIYADFKMPMLSQMNACGTQAIRDGAPGYELEFPLVKSDGTTFWLHERVSITSLSARQWQLIGFTIDTTARHEAETARASAESQLRQIMEGADCLLWRGQVVRARDGQQHWQIFVPPSLLFRKLFGNDPAPDRTYLWDSANDDVPEYDEMLHRCIEAIDHKRPSYEQDFHLRRPGKTFCLHEQVSITPTSPDTWTLVGVITDMTDRRETELALAVEKERLAVTLRTMSESVLTLDEAGIVRFINQAAAQLLHRDEAGIVGQPLAAVCALLDEDGAPLAPHLAKVLHEGTPLALPGYTRLTLSAHRTLLVEGGCAPVKDASGKITGAVLVLRDVTERHRLEEQMQRANKLESIGVLAGGIAHDFNNILTAILGNLSLAQEDAQDRPELARCLQEAELASNRARDLTHRLLTFAKGGDPILGAVALQQVISEVTAFTLSGLPTKVEFELSLDLWPAHADRGQIAQVVQNLVLNAAQAMPGGGILRLAACNETIHTATDIPILPGDYIRLTVADSGSGIPPKNLPKIFDPYFTTKRQGHGLGLATVYSIVKKHRGHIEVASTIGKGATFTVWLPALQTTATTTTPTAGSRLAAAPGHAKVLFMDDESSIVAIASKILERIGCSVEIAYDGYDAIKKYQAARAQGAPFDLVIMDLTVPGGMGGREAIQKLRELDPGVKAIVSSGYSGDPVLGDFRSFGFRGMVAKPYEIGEFSRTIQAVLDEN